MTLKVLADPSQLNPVSFWPSTVLLSVWMICNDSTNQISPSPIPTCWQNKYWICPQTGTKHVWMFWPTPVCWLGNLWVRGWNHRDQTQPQISFCSLRTWKKNRDRIQIKYTVKLKSAQQSEGLIKKIEFKTAFFCSPYPVTCPTITPAALHLSKTCDAALLPSEATARAIDEVYARLGVYCEVQEETHHLSVG